VSINIRHPSAVLFPLGLLLALTFILSCAVGRYPVQPLVVVRLFASRLFPSLMSDNLSEAAIVLFRVRLPRVVAAALVGAALSASGAAYQGIFRNPLVSPDVLGVSAGAGFGAALAIFLSFTAAGITLGSFAFGIGTALLVAFLARHLGNDNTLALVLSGIMTGSLLSSATSFLKLAGDPQNVLPAITYWLMGSLASVRENDILFAAPLILASLLLLYLLRWRINILTMGDEEARTLGTDIRLSRALVMTAATLATAACVSISGLIGWVGLVIPHFARLLAGSDYRVLMPAAMLMGASFLLLVDDLARMITASEIPLGILTSFVGVPFFLYLIRKGGKTE